MEMEDASRPWFLAFSCLSLKSQIYFSQQLSQIEWDVPMGVVKEELRYLGMNMLEEAICSRTGRRPLPFEYADMFENFEIKWATDLLEEAFRDEGGIVAPGDVQQWMVFSALIMQEVEVDSEGVPHYTNGVNPRQACFWILTGGCGEGPADQEKGPDGDTQGRKRVGWVQDITGVHSEFWYQRGRLF